MTPVFFGPSGSPLLGLLHEPEGGGGGARGHGVVLCPPVGQEHVRSHWAVRQVALALSREGFHALRFDWFGVGDSAGELASASVDRWREDLADAAQELRDSAGVRKISVVGLRLGATLAAVAASKVRPSSVVLWEPVLSGAAHVAELRRVQREILADGQRYWHTAERSTPRGELLGFDVGERLLGEIEALDVGSGAGLPRVPVGVVAAAPGPEVGALAEALRGRKVECEIVTPAVSGRWGEADAVEELVLPGDAVRAVVDFLSRRAR